MVVVDHVGKAKEMYKRRMLFGEEVFWDIFAIKERLGDFYNISPVKIGSWTSVIRNVHLENNWELNYPNLYYII